MRRFFCDPANIKDKAILLTDKDELHHMCDVIRLKPDDRITVLDGQGGKYFCKILQLGKDKARLEIFDEQHYSANDVETKLTVACALLKKDKMHFIVEKLTEVGVERIILIATERTTIKPKDIAQWIEKLKKVSLEAMKQSGTLFSSRIDSMEFSELLTIAKSFDIALLPNLAEDSITIRAVLNKFLRGNILAAIGPEGDFSAREIEQAKNAGFISVSLGETVLKAETAAIVVAGFVRLRTLLVGKGA